MRYDGLVISERWLHTIQDTPFEKIQCFPFYTYNEDGTNRRENITDWALAAFRKAYGDTKYEIRDTSGEGGSELVFRISYLGSVDIFNEAK